VIPPEERESDPRVGVTFDGTRRDVLIEDVIAVEGDRRPSAAESPKVHRQAFVYVVSQGCDDGSRSGREGESNPFHVGDILLRGDGGTRVRRRRG
jgi:hypothetical protein